MQYVILTIDDEVNIQELLSVNLEASGYTVFSITDARDSYKTIEHILPDLVILDVMMPDVDGWEICKYIKDNYADKIKILMLTARSTDKDKMIGKDILKADEFMTKPFEINELLKTVERLLDADY